MARGRNQEVAPSPEILASTGASYMAGQVLHQTTAKWSVPELRWIVLFEGFERGDEKCLEF